MRYDRLLVFIGDSPEATQVWGRLLLRHPTALREMKSLRQSGANESGVLSTRRADVLAEQERLRDGAPLPPPKDDDPRVRTLMVADVEWFLSELRALSRFGLRRDAEAAVRAYDESDRADPIPGAGEIVQAVMTVPRRALQLRVLEGFGQRYGRLDLARGVFHRPAGEPSPGVEVAPSGTLREGRALRIEAFGKKVAVFRHEGRLFALQDTCPHRGGSLGRGEIVDGCVLCPLHGWAFDLSTGVHRDNPAVRVAQYEVRESGGRIRLFGPEEVPR